VKLNLSDFSKLLSPHTRGYLDAKQWVKILKEVFTEVLIDELSKGNIVHLPFGDFSIVPNSQTIIKNSVNGEKNVPIKNQYQVRCSCPETFKEKVNQKFSMGKEKISSR
jgi:nucleoid DNA-binding protein